MNTNILSNFAHTNTTIALCISRLMAVKSINPNTFRLSVLTPDDTQEEGTGQYQVEAQVILQLLNTSYAEVVSALNRVTRKDQLIPLNDRHRHNSGWDDQYDGGENDAEPEETELTLEDQIVHAVDRAEIVLRYGKHIASIKQGGAEWLTGFEVDAWVPVQGLTDDKDGKFTVDQVKAACESEVDLETHILAGRVVKVRTVVDNRLMNFTAWCQAQVSAAKRKEKVTDWTRKCAYAATMGIELHDVPVNDAMNYIGDLVSKPAFNRKTSRLEDAVRQVGNAKYLSIAYALKSNVAALKVKDAELNKTFIKAFQYLPYSDMLQIDIANTLKSEDWLDHQLSLDIKQSEQDAKQNLRQAMREQAMFGMEQMAVQAQATNQQAQALRDMIAQQRAALYAPKPTQAEISAAEKFAAFVKEAAQAKKEKAAATRAAKAKEKAATKHLTGIAGTSNMPSYNTNRH